MKTMKSLRIRQHSQKGYYSFIRVEGDSGECKNSVIEKKTDRQFFTCLHKSKPDVRLKYFRT